MRLILEASLTIAMVSYFIRLEKHLMINNDGLAFTLHLKMEKKTPFLSALEIV